MLSQPRSCSPSSSSIVTTCALARITQPPVGRARSGRRRPAAVGQLQLRDHRQGEEGQQLERRIDRAAELSRGGDERAAALDDLVERRVGEEACDRQRQLGQHLGAVDDDDPAADVGEPAHRERHRRVARRRRRRRCGRRGRRSRRARPAAARSRARSPGRSARCRGGARSTAILAGRASGSATASPARCVGSSIEGLGQDLAGDQADHPRRPALPGNRGTAPGRGRRRASCSCTHSGTCARGISATRRARLQDDVGHEALEIGEEEQVGLVAGRDRAEVGEPVPERRVERCERPGHPPAGCRTRPRRAPSS